MKIHFYSSGLYLLAFYPIKSGARSSNGGTAIRGSLFAAVTHRRYSGWAFNRASPSQGDDAAPPWSDFLVPPPFVLHAGRLFPWNYRTTHGFSRRESASRERITWPRQTTDRYARRLPTRMEPFLNAALPDIRAFRVPGALPLEQLGPFPRRAPTFRLSSSQWRTHLTIGPYLWGTWFVLKDRGNAARRMSSGWFFGIIVL